MDAIWTQNINFVKFGRSVYNVLTKSSSKYELSGTMKIDVPEMGEKSFSFEKAGVVPFTSANELTDVYQS